MGSDSQNGVSSLREHVHHHSVCSRDKLGRASVVLRIVRIATKATDFDRRIVLETAALQLVLYGDSVGRRGSIPNVSKVLLLLQGHEPQIRTDDNRDKSIENQGPIQNGQTDRDMVTLENGSDRDNEGYCVHHA
jgi:hypothetical protein